MKKIFFMACFSFVNPIAVAASDLPFVGTKSFCDFSGGLMEHRITIKKNGNTVIEQASGIPAGMQENFSDADLMVIYRGKFKEKMANIMIKQNKAFLLDERGSVVKDCKEEGQPCVCDLR